MKLNRRLPRFALAATLALGFGALGCDWVGEALNKTVEAVDAVQQPELNDLELVGDDGGRLKLMTEGEPLVWVSIRKDMGDRINKVTLSPNASRISLLPRVGLELNGVVVVTPGDAQGKQDLEIDLAADVTYAMVASLRASDRNQTVYWDMPISVRAFTDGDVAAETEIAISSTSYFLDYLEQLYRKELSHLPELSPATTDDLDIELVAPAADATGMLLIAYIDGAFDDQFQRFAEGLVAPKFIPGGRRKSKCKNRKLEDGEERKAWFAGCVRFAALGVRTLDEVRYTVTANIEQTTRRFCSYERGGGALSAFVARVVVTDRTSGAVLGEKTFRTKKEKCPGLASEEDLRDPWEGAGKESFDTDAIGAWISTLVETPVAPKQ